MEKAEGAMEKAEEAAGSAKKYGDE